MNVFELVAKLTLDSSEYDSSLDSSEEKGSSFGSNLGTALSTGAKVAVGAVAGVTTAVVAVGAAFVKATGEVAAYGDTIDKESQKLGLSTDAYQEWDAILQHSGSSISALTPAMRTLQSQVEQGSEAFQALGLSQEQVASMSSEELFAATIAGLQGMGDETERNALASDLLGRSYMELQPLLNTSVEDTEAMRQAVHDLGGVMSEDAVKNAAAYQDALQDMNTAIEGTKRGILEGFMPSITQVMGGLTAMFSGDPASGIGQIKTGITNLITQLFSMAPQFIELASSMLNGFLTVLIENLPELVVAGADLIISLAEGILETLPTLVDAVFTLIQKVLTFLLERLPDFVEKGLEIVQSLAQGLIDNLPTIIAAIGEILMMLVQFIIEDLPNILQAGIEIIFALAEGLIDNLPTIISTIAQVIAQLLAYILENLPQFIATGIELIGQIIIGLIEAIPEIIAALPEIFSAIIDAFAEVDWLEVGSNIIDGIVSGIGGAVSRLWEAAVNAAKAALSKIKNVLGISSPSKVFRDQVGEMIPEGMAIGIEANTDAVEDAMQDLADITTDPFADVDIVTPEVETAGARGGVVINVYPREGQDEESIAEYVMEKLDLEYQREERALA